MFLQMFLLIREVARGTKALWLFLFLYQTPSHQCSSLSSLFFYFTNPPRDPQYSSCCCFLILSPSEIFFFSLNFIPLPFFYILVHFSSHFSHCLHSCRQDQVLLMIQQQKTFLLFRNLKRADDCKKSSFLLVCCIIVIFIHLCHKQNTCRLIKSAC